MGWRGMARDERSWVPYLSARLARDTPRCGLRSSRPWRRAVTGEVLGRQWVVQRTQAWDHQPEGAGAGWSGLVGTSVTA